MKRRTLLSGLALTSLSGCAGEVTVRQPTPTLPRVDQYGSHQNIRVSVRSVRFDRSRCRIRIDGTFTDIQWPKSDVRLILFLYNENDGVIHSAEETFEDVEPGEVVEFELERTFSACEGVEGYELVGRRFGR